MLFGAESGPPISIVIDSSVEAFVHTQSLLMLASGFPETEIPNADEMSCGDSIEQTSMFFEDSAAFGGAASGATVAA